MTFPELIRHALFDPGFYCERIFNKPECGPTEYEALHCWQQRALEKALHNSSPEERVEFIGTIAKTLGAPESVIQTVKALLTDFPAPQPAKVAIADVFPAFEPDGADSPDYGVHPASR